MRNSKELARRNEVAWRLMSVPGVGPGARLHRGDRDRGEIRRIRDIGTHLGLTERRYQSADNDLKMGVRACRKMRPLVKIHPFTPFPSDVAGHCDIRGGRHVVPARHLIFSPACLRESKDNGCNYGAPIRMFFLRPAAKRHVNAAVSVALAHPNS
jgi:hypothetical protein